MTSCLFQIVLGWLPPLTPDTDTWLMGMFTAYMMVAILGRCQSP